MKSLVAAILILTPLAQAKTLNATAVQWTCDSKSFPNQTDVKVYLKDGMYLGQISQEIYDPSNSYEDNDGDTEYEVIKAGTDLVQLELVANNSSGLTFRQINEGRLDLQVANVKSKGVARGVYVQISTSVVGQKFDKVLQAGLVKAKVGPNKEALEDRKLSCWSATK